MKIAVASHSGVLNEARLANVNTENVVSLLLESYNNYEYDSVYLIEVSNGEANITFCGPFEEDYAEYCLTPAYQQPILFNEMKE